MDDLDQFLGGFAAGIGGRCGGVDHVFADMVLDDLGDEAVQGPAAGGGLLQHARALLIFADRPRYGLDLAAQTAQAVQQLGLLPRDVAHAKIPLGYYRGVYYIRRCETPSCMSLLRRAVGRDSERGVMFKLLTSAALGLACASGAALAQTSDQSAQPQTWAVHGQATVVLQGHDAFRSPYSGPQSLDAAARGNETADATLYIGVRPWAGLEVWVNPEVDQGFGMQNTLGVAGFPSGEAYKVGARDPYLRLPRLFLRQTFDLGGERQAVDPDLNVLGGSHTADRLVLTIGKFGVTDVFDANDYAHDPRQDFFNWTLIDTGTFDYAADAWGYTYGASAELYKGPWALVEFR